MGPAHHEKSLGFFLVLAALPAAATASLVINAAE
jgi:hypothetical protein